MSEGWVAHLESLNDAANEEAAEQPRPILFEGEEERLAAALRHEDELCEWPDSSVRAIIERLRGEA